MESEINVSYARHKAELANDSLSLAYEGIRALKKSLGDVIDANFDSKKSSEINELIENSERLIENSREHAEKALWTLSGKIWVGTGERVEFPEWVKLRGFHRSA